MNLNSILIGSEDPKRLGDYYSKLFGAPGFEDSGYIGWQLGNGFLTVGPHDQIHGTSKEPGRVLWNIEVEDVPGEFARLVAAGAQPVAEPYHPGPMVEAWIATLSDPDGNYFQLMSPMPV